MWSYRYSSEIQHFGIPGMKWGVRKKREKFYRGGKQYSIPKKKSGHRVRLEAGYLKKGYSESDAEQMAARRIKGEKFVAGALGTAAVAGASYIAYREIGKRYSSVVLEAGTDLHYINALGDKATYDRRLYTSFEKGDTKKYKGLLATALRKNAADTTIYDTVLRTTETVKAPSQHEAAKLYKEFLSVNKDLPKWSYNEMNRRIVGTMKGDDPTAAGFMSFLKTKGYNAILDANDQFISGYSTKKPLILFNAASSTVKVGESVVSKQLSDRLNKIQMAVVYTKELAPSIGLGVAMVGGRQALDTSNKYGAVNSYFKKNPKSNYSYGAVYNALKATPSGNYIVDETLLKGV